jgi:hypothetical protein
VLRRKKLEICRGNKKNLIILFRKFLFSLNRQYSDEEDDNDSPLSDNGRPQPPTRFSNRHQ